MMLKIQNNKLNTYRLYKIKYFGPLGFFHADASGWASSRQQTAAKNWNTNIIIYENICLINSNWHNV